MAGLDPLAAAAAAQLASTQAAIDEAVLSLGADIPVLQAQVSVGDVVAATVLPPQNGSDLLSFLGQTIPAQIPPGINPGESLLLQVTAFTNSAVIVKNLGTLDPDNPVQVVNVQLPPAEPGAPQSATLTTVLSDSTQLLAMPEPASRTPVAIPPSSPGVAPPRAVFIEAVVRASPQATPRADAAPPRFPPAAVAPPASPLDNDVEARIALSRAATAAPGVGQTPLPGRAPVAPPIVEAPNTSQPGSIPQAPASSLQAPAITPRAPETPEEALLAQLRIPVTPATLAAARSIENATAILTGAYDKLDAVLARMSPAQVPAALRTTLAFVSRLDLRNTAALAEQLSAFVGDVVDGAEAKIAAIIEQWSSLVPEIPAPPGAEATPAQVTSVAAQAAERGVALQFDPKAAMQQMLSAQPASSAPELIAALRTAIGATTAVQLGALAAAAKDPGSITLALPAYFYQGGAPAQLRIERDLSNGKTKMDPDNFHISFILDTQSLGTVAIDVQTVGRAVSVDVKTQAPTAADRFRASFGELRGRLEKLRYRVANIGAGVAAPLGAKAKQAEPVEKPRSRFSIWDSRA
jgi:hypothetical protein